MDSRPLHVGIDLGTTNSTAAIFDGQDVTVVRNGQGSMLTPSVVRVDSKGNVLVGARARRFLDTDPANTRGEFKRLMGTSHELDFPASGQKRTPAQLAAEVLRSLRRDVEDQCGVAPERAVVSVPALFELPQTSATSEAARLAGFERIELIQEPVASAIAAGWSADDDSGAWLVYDLGGGTFDVSLLETREGLLRVVAHDGDNFLGGRDFDGVVVDWLVGALAESGTKLDRANPAHALALRRLRFAAEEAKIELTRVSETSVLIPGLSVGDETVEVDVTLTRDKYEALIAPLVDRSVSICRRLVASRGIEPGSLRRVVLVGGPTVTPSLRERVRDGLGAPLAEGFDPMTLVAQGAAVFAGTVGLDARPVSASVTSIGPKVWLQYPAMTSDLAPFVIGRLLDDAHGIEVVRVRRADGSWEGSDEPVDAQGTFAASVSLVPRQRCELLIDGRRADSDEFIPLSPHAFSITHGLTVGEPPLSRSVGVALADDKVRHFFERGSPLPMRRTHALRTVSTVRPGASDYVLRIPIVQGEFPMAHLCRLVGALEIPASALTSPVPAGTPVNLTLELDRGGQLRARAHVEGITKVFDHVEVLVTHALSHEDMSRALGKLRERHAEVLRQAFRTGSRTMAARLAETDLALPEVERAIEAAAGGDLDAGERARRQLGDLDAMLADIEGETAWPELARELDETHSESYAWVAGLGTEEERAMVARAFAEGQRALQAKDADEVGRQIGVLRTLINAVYLRHPKGIASEIGYYAEHVADCTDPRRAAQLVSDGKAALKRGDNDAARRILSDLWAIRPVEREEQDRSFGSGLRES